MPPKKQEGVARFRVTLPQDVYDRIEVIATKMSLDVPTMVRVMASLQLVTWENLANPLRMMSPEVQKQLARQWTQEAAGMFPEERHPEQWVEEADQFPVFNPNPEPEPKPADRPGVGFRPKAELDDVSSFSLLEAMIAGS